MKCVSSNLLHLSIYQYVIQGITNRFCPHYQKLHKLAAEDQLCAENTPKLRKVGAEVSTNGQKTKNPAFQLGFCAGEGTRTPTPLGTRS